MLVIEKCLSVFNWSSSSAQLQLSTELLFAGSSSRCCRRSVKFCNFISVNQSWAMNLVQQQRYPQELNLHQLRRLSIVVLSSVYLNGKYFITYGTSIVQLMFLLEIFCNTSKIKFGFTLACTVNTAFGVKEIELKRTLRTRIQSIATTRQLLLKLQTIRQGDIVSAHRLNIALQMTMLYSNVVQFSVDLQCNVVKMMVQCMKLDIFVQGEVLSRNMHKVNVHVLRLSSCQPFS